MKNNLQAIPSTHISHKRAIQLKSLGVAQKCDYHYWINEYNELRLSSYSCVKELILANCIEDSTACFNTHQLDQVLCRIYGEIPKFRKSPNGWAFDFTLNDIRYKGEDRRLADCKALAITRYVRRVSDTNLLRDLFNNQLAGRDYEILSL